jgi:Leucine-rich repeat (LRR) protein
LEHIDVSNNKISSLKAIANLRYLVTLNLSHNNLTLLDFR